MDAGLVAIEWLWNGRGFTRDFEWGKSTAVNSLKLYVTALLSRDNKIIASIIKVRDNVNVYK